MKLFDQEMMGEKEMSGGAMFGKILILFIAVMIVAFGIFALGSVIKNKTASSNNTEIQTEISQDIDSTE